MKISIITITFKDLDGLKKTMKSIFDQTFSDFECLIIDGGSGPEVIQFLGSINDPRISWISERDNGIFDAMNKGIDRAVGDWLIFMNGGDSFYAANTLEKVASTLSTEHDLVYGNYLWEYGDRPSTLKNARDCRYIYYGLFSCHQAMFFRNDFVGDIRYEKKYRVAGDYAYVCEVIKRKAVCVRLEIPICRFDMNGSSNQLQGVGRSEYSIIQRDVLKMPSLLISGFRYLHFLAATARKLVAKITPASQT